MLLRTLSSGLVEIIRGVPIISLLFVASFLLPLILPLALSQLDIVLRVALFLSLFASVYVCEVIRGSLRALPKGQWEAASSLGLSYWKTQRKVILPQVLTLSIPGLTNIAIGMFKSTSLVLTIGLIDFLNSAKQAYGDPIWSGAFIEVLMVSALVYFVFCNLIAWYGRSLERRFRPENRALKQNSFT